MLQTIDEMSPTLLNSWTQFSNLSLLRDAMTTLQPAKNNGFYKQTFCMKEDW